MQHNLRQTPSNATDTATQPATNAKQDNDDYTATTDNDSTTQKQASNPYRQQWAADSQPAAARASNPYRQRWAAESQPEASKQAATRQDKTTHTHTAAK